MSASVRGRSFPRLSQLLLPALVPALLLCLAAARARAGSPTVSVSGGDSLSIWVRVDWDQPLPTFVLKRLERGIPATVGLRTELWRSRSGWFDEHLASEGLEIKVLKDSWGESYTLLGEHGSQTADSLAGLQTALSSQKASLPVESSWCDDGGSYRIVVTTYVRPLTTKDVGEVEIWLRGELRGFGSGVLGLPRGLFGIVRDLSGLGERTSTGSSRRFQISRVSGNRVRVLIPGEESNRSDADY